MRPGAVESWVQEQALVNFHRSVLLLPESAIRIDSDKDEYLGFSKIRDVWHQPLPSFRETVNFSRKIMTKISVHIKKKSATL